MLPHCQFDSGHKVDLWRVVPDFEYQTCKDENFSYYLCIDCDSIFLWLPPTERLSEIYPTNYYSFIDEGYSILYRIKFFLDRKKFKNAFKVLNFDEINILDVGGGIGHLAEQARRSFLPKKGINTWICDLDFDAKARAEANGHIYLQSTFEDLNIQNRFQVILAFNIIEHVVDPMKFLEKIHDLLESGGIAIIQTPNWKSWDASLFKNSYWGGLHAPRHFYIFSKESLKREVELRGLEILTHQNVPAGSFWTYSILSFYKRFRPRVPNRPMYEWRFHNVLVAVFSVIDLLRGLLFQTSQQYLVLKKL